MKKSKIMILFIMLLGFIALPNNIKAEEEVKYNSLNFKQTLTEEEMELKATDYKETDNQITIYLFRGKGCGFCRAFLEFMNSISPEYGKYFKMVSYEVWNDGNNSKLLTKVSNYLNEPASGVPYIVIGDKVFGGYTSSYDEDIKKAIVDLYNTKKNKRYDVMVQMKKDPNKTGSSLGSSEQVWLIIICNFVFTTVASLMIMSHFNKKYNALYEKLENTKLTSKENNTEKVTKTKEHKKQK